MPSTECHSSFVLLLLLLLLLCGPRCARLYFALALSVRLSVCPIRAPKSKSEAHRDFQMWKCFLAPDIPTFGHNGSGRDNVGLTEFSNRRIVILTRSLQSGC